MPLFSRFASAQGNGLLTGDLLDAVVSATAADALIIASRLAGTATLDNDPGVPLTFTDASIVTTLAVSPGPECYVLFLDLGWISLSGLGEQVQLDRIALDASLVPHAPEVIRQIVCGISQMLEDGSPCQDVAAGLNQLIGQHRVQLLAMGLLGALGVRYAAAPPDPGNQRSRRDSGRKRR